LRETSSNTARHGKLPDFFPENRLSRQWEQGGRPPIFLIHGRVGFTLPKPAFRKVFGEDQEFHVFELPGLRGGRSYDRIEDIAAVYVEQLVERCPRGPVLLVSFCVGALIALEMAAQLAARGRSITQLVLLDPSLPKNRGVDLKRQRKKKAGRENGEAPLPAPFGAKVLWQKMRDAARASPAGARTLQRHCSHSARSF
jgi:thioesterase domain-containing protein